ncbi:hypothetical protein PMAYCL1PPCAC_12778, partial [Pristionchus mayeri]
TLKTSASLTVVVRSRSEPCFPPGGGPDRELDMREETEGAQRIPEGSELKNVSGAYHSGAFTGRSAFGAPGFFSQSYRSYGWTAYLVITAFIAL